MRALVVDDHEVVREGLRNLLEGDEQFEVVDVASNAEEAVRLAARHQPDVVILDFRLPDAPGDKVCRSLRSVAPRSAVIVMTSYTNDGAVRGALAAGAAGYVTKTAGLDALRQVICDVLVDPEGRPAVVRSDAGSGSARLSTQDQELLELAAEGLSDREIARRLHLAESTVRFHMQKLKGRLGATSKTGLVAKAIREGLISLDGEGT